MPGVEDFVAPIIEREIELQSISYPLMKIQPLPSTFKWNDKYLEAGSRIFCIDDGVNGESAMIMLVIAVRQRSY
jgi:hypothetical protein